MKSSYLGNIIINYLPCFAGTHLETPCFLDEKQNITDFERLLVLQIENE